LNDTPAPVKNVDINEVKSQLEKLVRNDELFVTNKQMIGYLLSLAALFVAAIGGAAYIFSEIVDAKLDNSTDRVVTEVEERINETLNSARATSSAEVSEIGSSIEAINQKVEQISASVSELSVAISRGEERSKIDDTPPENGAQGVDLFASQLFEGSILEASGTAPGISLFLGLLKESAYSSALESNGKFTLLAPTNQALEQLPEPDFFSLFQEQDTQLVNEFVGAHILSEEIGSESFGNKRWPSVDGTHFLFLQGNQFFTATEDGFFNEIQGARVLQEDVKASNGFIHVIDDVLLPERF